MLVLGRTAARAAGPEQARRRAELERLALALAAHDPDRTLARGYALVEDGAGDPVTSAAAAREAEAVRLRFRDGRVGAKVTE
jgi:exodeoxyribonuclease VII large subunit